MSNSCKCSINENLGYYLEDKLEKYKSHSADALCGPLELGEWCSVHSLHSNILSVE